MSTLPTRATPRHASPERRWNSLMRFFVRDRKSVV